MSIDLIQNGKVEEVEGFRLLIWLFADDCGFLCKWLFDHLVTYIKVKMGKIKDLGNPLLSLLLLLFDS